MQAADDTGALVAGATGAGVDDAATLVAAAACPHKLQLKAHDDRIKSAQAGLPH